MVKQVKPLSDVENIGFGLLCGFTDVALFQPMNYWKNAVQQSLPFTLNPSLLYRGADVDARDAQGCTALLIAAQYGQADAAAYLIKARALSRGGSGRHLSLCSLPAL